MHRYKGVSMSGECFCAVFLDQVWLLCSVGMEGRAEGNPELSPLAVPWFLLGTDLDDRLDSQSSACTPALWTFGCERGLRLPETNPWSTQGVGIESTAVIGLKPCSFGAAVLANR